MSLKKLLIINGLILAILVILIFVYAISLSKAPVAKSKLPLESSETKALISQEELDRQKIAEMQANMPKITNIKKQEMIDRQTIERNQKNMPPALLKKSD